MSNYPSSLDTNDSLYVAVNDFNTTLNGAIDSTQTSIAITDATGLNDVGEITIESEIIYYAARSGNTLTSCTRGHGGTTNTAHLTGVVVEATITESYHNNLKDAVIAVETELGVDPAGASATVAARATAIESEIADVKKGNKALFNNDSGSQINQYRLVKVVDDDATSGIASIEYISSFDDKIAGFALANIADGADGDCLIRGRVAVTGFDCSGASKEDKVYSDASGNLTLVETDLEVGQVLDTLTNGVVYINIGAGAGGSGLLDGTDKRLGVARISSADTDTDIYSPASGYAVGVKVVIFNDNTSGVAKVDLYNRDGVKADEDTLLPSISIAAQSEPITVLLSGIKSTETLTARSDTTNVNFAAFGQEVTSDKGAYCVGRHDISVVDTDEDLVAFTDENQCDITVCNRNAAETATVLIKVTDGASAADEDKVYSSQILPNQSKVIALDFNVANTYKVVVQSDVTGVNFQAYARAKTEFMTSMILPAEVMLSRAKDYFHAYMATTQSSSLSTNDTIQLDGVKSNNMAWDSGNYKLTLKANKKYKLTYICGRFEFSSASGTAYPQFYDVTNTTYIGQRALSLPASFASNISDTKVLTHTITPSTDIEIDIRLVSVGNLSAISGGSDGASQLIVEEISQVITYVKNPYQVDYYNDTTDRVSGTNWTTTRCSLRPYMTADGSWFLKFNIRGTVSSPVSILSLTVAGVTFNTAAGTSAITVSADTAGNNGYTDAGASTMTLLTSSTQSTFRCSGDVELDSKPSWI